MGDITFLKGLLSGTKTVAELIGIWKDYRRARAHRRMDKVQEHLRTRVDGLEKRIEELALNENDFDLFMSVLFSLIQDDEEQKIPYYAAFLDFFLGRPTHDVSDRLIAEAIKTLTVAELELLAVYESKKRRGLNPPDWLEVRFPTRLQSLGLCIDPNRSAYETRLTSIGRLTQNIAKGVLQN